MNPDSDLISSLVKCPRADFRLLVAQRDLRINVPERHRVNFLVDLVCELVISNLARRDRADRVSLIFTVLRLNSVQTAELAGRARGLDVAAKGLLTAVLPPELIATVYDSELADDSHIPVTTNDGSLPAGSSGLVHTDGADESAVVVLVSTNDQKANRSLLEGNNYSVHSARDIIELKNVLSGAQDACGCVVDASFLSQYGRDDQIDVFNTIAGTNSFMWIRTQEESLCLSWEELQVLIKRSWCASSDISANQLSIRDGSEIKQGELGPLWTARQRLNAFSRHTFAPGDFAIEQLKLIAASVSDYFRMWDEIVDRDNHSLNVRLLPDGRTSAKLVFVDIDDGAKSIVAKVDSRDRVLDESQRFLTHISEWQPGLEPRTYFLGGNGAILFRVVSDLGKAGGPAPTLHHQLRSLYLKQLYPKFASPEQLALSDTVQTLLNTVAKLKSLNISRPSTSQFLSHPPFTDLGHLRGQGEGFGLSLEEWNSYDIAAERFSGLMKDAVVHGDVNLHNILVIQSRVPYFVDFSETGMGHPAVDLVRLELSLFLSTFVPCGSSENCRELQVALSCLDLDIDEVLRQFPMFGILEVNQATLTGMVAARDAAIDLVKAAGGSKLDYLAAKYLVAWCGMVTSGLQISLARSTLSAIAPAISDSVDA